MYKMVEATWKDIDIPLTPEEHLEEFRQLRPKVLIVYSALLAHLEKIVASTERPSEIEILMPVLEQFSNMVEETSRVVTKLMYYLQNVSVEQLGSHLKTHEMEKQNGLHTMLSLYHKSLLDSPSCLLMNELSNLKDKNLGVFYPRMALLEKTTIKAMLNVLTQMQSYLTLIPKHVNSCNLPSITDKSISTTPHSFYG